MAQRVELKLTGRYHRQNHILAQYKAESCHDKRNPKMDYIPLQALRHRVDANLVVI